MAKLSKCESVIDVEMHTGSTNLECLGRSTKQEALVRRSVALANRLITGVVHVLIRLAWHCSVNWHRSTVGLHKG